MPYQVYKTVEKTWFIVIISSEVCWRVRA